MKKLDIPDVLYFQPRVFKDDRGSFVETWNAAREAAVGFNEEFVQDNVVHSKYGVMRGLHFQTPYPQGKYVTAAYGTIYDVAVDIRPASSTFGKWVAKELSADTGGAVYIPPGFAHGYQVLTPEAVVMYKCTEYYHPECDKAVFWNDSQLAIEWPISDPILSAKDRDARGFDDLCRDLGLRGPA